METWIDICRAADISSPNSWDGTVMTVKNKYYIEMAIMNNTIWQVTKQEG